MYGIGYGAPPPPPPQVIMIQQKKNAKITNMAVMGDMAHCPCCEQKTANVLRPVNGCVTFTWCCFLLFLTGGLLSLLPFCCDSCKDAEIICQKCMTVKTKIQANCC